MFWPGDEPAQGNAGWLALLMLTSAHILEGTLVMWVEQVLEDRNSVLMLNTYRRIIFLT